jgi:hypothetical protein
VSERNGRYESFLDQLLIGLRKRDGDKEIGRLKNELEGFTREATYREAIVQLIAKQKLRYRLALLLLKPTLIIPYLIRIKRIR